MKKLIYCALALAVGLFATSCQQENLEPEAKGNTVTYTVELPDVQTKAIGDASTVDQLIYEVWKTETADERDLTNSAKATRLYQDQTALVQRNGKTCAVITFNLVQDQEYTILFWAQKNGAGVYNTENLTDVHYAKGCEPGSSEYFSNQENYAAFYAADFVSDEDTKSRTVILKRPFAQLNIATKNTVEDYTVELNSSRVVISSVATHFNVAQNLPATPAVGKPVSFDFTTADVPTDPAKITVNGQEYDYVAMNYVFANGNAIVSYEINTTLYSHSDANTQTTAQIKNTVPNVPLKENYRTNIVGNLLTSTTEYYIEIDDSWYDEPGDGTEVEVWDGLYAQEPYWNETEQQYEISLASELTWLSHRVNGTLENPKAETKNIGFYAPESFNGIKFVLKEDIDLQGVVWTPIGTENSNFYGDFYGNGKTISNFSVNAGDKAAGLFGYMGFGSIKNLTISNAVINGTTYAGALVGWVQNPGTSNENRATTIIENCVARNVAVTTVPNVDKDNGAKAGGLVGYAVRTKISGCAVEYSDVSAYRDCGGLLGMANSKASVVDNTVTNVNVVANQACEYITAEFANADEIIGRISADAGLIEGNTATNTSVVVKVNTGANLQLQANKTKEDINIEFGGDTKGNAIIDQREGINIYVNGAGKKFDGTIMIDGNSRNEGAEVVVLENINFETTAADRNFIEQNSAESAVRYAHNVTVRNCTFKGNASTVGAKLRQCYNIKFEGCEMYSGHSLAQFYGCTGVTIHDIIVNAARGISFGTSTVCEVKNSSFDVEKYGVRADATVEAELKLENVNINAKLPVIARDYSNSGYKISFAGSNTLTAPGYHVVLTTGDDEDIFVAPAEYAEVEGADGFRVFPGSDDYYAYSAAEFQSLLDRKVAEIKLLSDTYEGTFKVGYDAKIISVDANNPATIKGRVNIVNANPVFENVNFDRNETDSNAAWNAAYGSSNCLQYKAVVMIYGNQLNKVTFNNCKFYNNGGTHKSAITNTAVELLIDNCYFEGRSSAIYTQANISMTNSTIKYTGTNNVVLSINGCGDAGGKVIFKNNKVTGDNIFALGQFLSTTEFGNGKYHFDVQGNEEKFDNYFFNTQRVTNKEFASGSLTF